LGNPNHLAHGTAWPSRFMHPMALVVFLVLVALAVMLATLLF